MEDNFSMDQCSVGVGDDFKMVQATLHLLHFISIIHILYYFYISSTSDNQALDPRGWGPLFYIIQTDA